MTSVKVTNICSGARGIFVTGDVSATMIEPGASVVLDLPDADLADAEATGWFELSDPDAPEPVAEEGKPLSRMNKAELLAVAEAENILVIETATNREIVAAIEAARGE